MDVDIAVFSQKCLLSSLDFWTCLSVKLLGSAYTNVNMQSLVPVTMHPGRLDSGRQQWTD